jgi:hypothetical protein
VAQLSLAFSILAKDNASKEFDRVGDAADRAGKKGDGFGKLVKAGVAAAGVAVAAFAKSSVTAFVESEQSSVRLDEALRKFPATADVTRASFDQLNAALAQKTKFDDDATASGQAVLAQFQLTGTQIQELTPLLQDYAAKTGKDLPTAAEDLGKALLGQGRSLKEVGIEFTDTGSTAGNFDQIMGGLRKQVGGFATAEGQTAAGQAAILTNRFGEVQEQVGAKLVPVLSDLAAKLLTATDFVQRNSTAVSILTATVGTAAAGLFVAVKATAAFNAVALAMGSSVTIALGPVGLIIIALAALAAGVVVAYKKSETFRDIVSGAMEAVKGAFLTLSSAALGVISAILGGYQELATAAGKLPGPLGAPFRAAAEAIGGAKLKVDALKAGIEVLKGKNVTIDADTGPARRATDQLLAYINSRQGRVRISGVNSVGGIAERAHGGPLAAGQLSWVGERGPELVRFDRPSYVYSNPQSMRMAAGGDDSALLAAMQENTAAVMALREDMRRMPTAVQTLVRQGSAVTA